MAGTNTIDNQNTHFSPQTGVNTAPPVIIMIHGFRGTHHGLEKIAEHIPDSFRVVIPDIPGFGEGDTLTNYTLEHYVAWLESFIQSLNLSQPPILLGHSFGSIISAAYASQHPATIEKLVLVNPIGAPALEGSRFLLTKIALMYYRIGQYLPQKLARMWLASKPSVRIMSMIMAKTKDTKLRRWIHQQHDTHFSTFHSARAVSEAFDTSVTNSVRDVAPKISTKTLLIAGALDDITPVRKQHELQQLISGSQLVVLPHTGHLTHYETPREVAELVYDFIKSA